MRLPWRPVVLGCLIVGTGVGLVLLYRPEANGATALRAPPIIPVLTASAFDATADAELLPCLSNEAVRQLLAAGAGWGAGRKVLTEPLCHLWTITVAEPDLLQTGFAHLADLGSGPRPMMPPLSDLAAAYSNLGPTSLAEIATEAVAAQTDGTLAERAPDLDRRFRQAAAAPGIGAKRISYARQHRTELLTPAHPIQ
jgi:hypothetical protein